MTGLSSKVSSTTTTSAIPSQPKMQPPTTTHDNASPSDSLLNDVDRVFRLMEDERHLSARSLYHSIQERISTHKNSETAANSPPRRLHFRSRFHNKNKEDRHNPEFDKAQEMINKNQERLDKLEDRCLLFEKAKYNLTVDDGWTVAQTLFGVTTSYRRESDGSLSIKLEGSLHGVSLFDQVAVLREIDLHYKWAPFCSSSLTVRHLDKLDTVGWFCVGLPHFGLMRDGCFRAIGCDSIYEDGTVLLVAQGIRDRPEDGADNKHLEPLPGTPQLTPTGSSQSSASAKLDQEEERRLFSFLSEDPVLEKLDVPPPPTRIGSGRITIRTFQALINIESPTVATTKLVTNIDPNLPLIPQSLIDFLMKRLCGVLLSKMQGAAKKIARDPVTNHHAVKMREERDFYQRWLLPKFKDVCELRGWTMPLISAFQLSAAQVDVANALSEKNNRKKGRKPIRHAKTISEDKLNRYLDASQLHSFAESEPIDVGHTKNNGHGPKIRTKSFDSDDFSELSRNSASTAATLLSNNPISKYLREIEERTQARKDTEIRESRERASNRLKPKELDEESRSRLEELQIARNHRSATPNQKAVEPLSTPRDFSITTKGEPAQAKHSWAVFWTKHGIITKIIVISLLTGSLFGLLYSDPIFHEIVPSQATDTFWMARRKDTATFAYMGTAGFLHFCLCYVALMYAFSALQLGSIAGKQAKKFYSHNVHFILAVVSTSKVLLGAIYTGFYNACQWVVWRAHLLSDTVGGMIPSVPAAISSPFVSAYDVMISLLSLIERIAIESTFVGRGIRSSLQALWRIPERGFSRWNSFVELSIGEYEGRITPTPWREQAFFTTRALLSYSAIFLLVLLITFNLMAWQARHIKKVVADENVEGKNSGGERGTSASRGQSSQSSSPAFDTIQEE